MRENDSLLVMMTILDKTTRFIIDVTRLTCFYQPREIFLKRFMNIDS